MSSAADTLRRAAEVLRERAGVATPGPWEPYVLGSEGYDVRGPQTSIPGRRIARSTRVARCGYEEWEVDKANAAYIATVDPTVGLALADWLDQVAAMREESHDGPLAMAIRAITELAGDLARAILGGPAMSSPAHTPTLAEFLLARVAEDEAEVNRWQAAMEADEVAARGVPSWVVMAGGLKIPARVLAECEAKRRVVEKAHRADEAFRQQINPASSAASFALTEVLHMLAQPYADHPDFRDEWRP